MFYDIIFKINKLFNKYFLHNYSIIVNNKVFFYTFTD